MPGSEAGASESVAASSVTEKSHETEADKPEQAQQVRRHQFPFTSDLSVFTVRLFFPVCAEEEDCPSGAAPTAPNPQAPPRRGLCCFPRLLLPPCHPRPRPLPLLPRGGHSSPGWLFRDGYSGVWAPSALTLPDPRSSLRSHAYHCRYVYIYS